MREGMRVRRQRLRRLMGLMGRGDTGAEAGDACGGGVVGLASTGW